jgi:uncharacterized protein DUF5615
MRLECVGEFARGSDPRDFSADWFQFVARESGEFVPGFVDQCSTLRSCAWPVSSGKTDREVREFAIQTERALVTLDADFANLVRFSEPERPGCFGRGPHRPDRRLV